MRGAYTLIMLLTVLTAFRAADAEQPREPMWSVSAGKLGVLDDSSDPFELGVAYRFRPFGRWSLVPAAGLLVNNDGAYFIYTELRRDFGLGGSWLFTPSVGIGLFEEGEVLDLGHTVEFRSGLELGYRFHNAWRAGLAFFHISNGGIGRRNPGSEALVLSLSIPVRRREPAASPE